MYSRDTGRGNSREEGGGGGDHAASARNRPSRVIWLWLPCAAPRPPPGAAPGASGRTSAPRSSARVCADSVTLARRAASAHALPRASRAASQPSPAGGGAHPPTRAWVALLCPLHPHSQHPLRHRQRRRPSRPRAPRAPPALVGLVAQQPLQRRRVRGRAKLPCRRAARPISRRLSRPLEPLGCVPVGALGRRRYRRRCPARGAPRRAARHAPRGTARSCAARARRRRAHSTPASSGAGRRT